MHNAATPNTGTMPTTDVLSTHLGAGSDATGALTPRAADGTIGTANPDTEATATAAANTSAQRLILRRFVSPPLAARTFATADGTWTYSFGAYQSNANHQGLYHMRMFIWRPSTGAQVGSGALNMAPASVMTNTTEANFTDSSGGGSTYNGGAILDGDILVFDWSDEFTQAMSSAYTTTFSYDGTTEGSTTTNAAFVNAPVALTLFTAGTTYTKSGHGVEHG